MTKKKYIVAEIHKWMKLRNKEAADMAHAMGVSIPTWYRKMRMPETMTVADLEMLEAITRLELLRGEYS